MRDIEKEIKKLNETYGTLNPYELADAMGVEIHYMELGSTRGLFYHSRRIKQIALSNTLTEWTERFVLAHEIGHLVMHPQHNAPFLSTTFFSKDRYEMEANAFALHMLISDDDLKEYPEYTVDTWATILGVPRELMELRFNTSHLQQGCEDRVNLYRHSLAK